MLIVLDDDLSNIAYDNHDALQVFVEVLMAHHLGFHFVIASRPLCDNLLCRDIGSPAKKAISSIREKINSISLIDSVDYYLRITKNSTICNGPEIGRPIKKFFGLKFTKSALVAEDISDAKLYIKAAKHFSINKKIKGFDVKLRHIHGGGEEIYNVLNNELLENNSPVICITDSDFFYDGAKLSAKSIKCNKVVEEAMSSFPNIHMTLPVREIENLIPVKLMSELEVEADNIDQLAEFHQNDEQAYKFIDLKNGTNKCWLCKNYKNKDFRSFWEPRVNSIAPNLQLCNQPKADVRSCIDNTKIISPAKRNLAESLLTFLSRESDHKGLEAMNCGSQGEDWLQIGKSIFSWGIAHKAI